MAAIVFLPSGLRGDVPEGITVLDAARQLGVDLDSVCGGRGICGRCQVVPTFGDFAKFAILSSPSNISAQTTMEDEYDGRRAIEADARLGCAARVRGDLIVDVPAASQVHRPVIRKSVDLADLVVDPIVRLHYVVVVENELGGDRSDVELLGDALSQQWSLPPLTITPTALIEMQPALNAMGAPVKRAVTVAVHAASQIIAVFPGLADGAYGIAVDVGSTTIAGHLCDLESGEVLASAGIMNPQIRFGEDLMSRVSYVMMNPGGKDDLVLAVRGALDGLVGTLVDLAASESRPGITRKDLLDLVIVGNPIMHHLVLGIDPTPLGTAPFSLATASPVDGRATDIGVDAPHSALHLLPCIAGHVGADTAGAVLAVGPHRGDEVTLLIDVGTNAEIVLGNRNGLLAASSPTGPAFEGAQISSGQRATAGAIERVRIDRETLEPRLRVIGSTLWSDEPGFAASLPEGGVTGVCGSGIIEAVAELFLAGVIDGDGRIVGTMALRTPRVVADGRTFAYHLTNGENPLRVTQNDVRAIQLAKAALYAGAKLLMDRSGLETVDTVKLAGAFGSHIDPVYALVLGMIPDCSPDKVVSVGNAAGTGAVRALLSAADRAEIAAVARKITKVETAVEPKFQQHFVEAMGLPHSTDPYVRLGAVVALPDRSALAAASTSRRGRRRDRS